MKNGPSGGEVLWLDHKEYKKNSLYTSLTDEYKQIVDSFRENGCYLYKNGIGYELIDRVK